MDKIIKEFSKMAICYPVEFWQFVRSFKRYLREQDDTKSLEAFKAIIKQIKQK